LIGLAAVLLTASRCGATGSFIFGAQSVRTVTAWQRTSTSPHADDSLAQVAASPFANFNGLVTLSNVDGFSIVCSASQYNVLSPNQIVARGRSSLRMNARAGLEDYSHAESNLDVFFHLNEPHDAPLNGYWEDTDVAGGVIAQGSLTLDGDGPGGGVSGAAFAEPHFALVAGDHELVANVSADGIINDTDPAELHHEGHIQYFLVINLDGGTADVPIALRAPRVSLLINPVHDEAVLSYVVPHPGTIRLEILDVAGRVIASLVDGAFSSSSGRAHWSASGSPAGLYFARLEGEDLAPLVSRIVVVH
jgi:hypothetical protein